MCLASNSKQGEDARTQVVQKNEKSTEITALSFSGSHPQRQGNAGYDLGSRVVSRSN